MTKRASGTDAKDIALHFVNACGIKTTRHNMAKTTNQAKYLLEAGYTKREILDAIDYIIDVMKIEMYSLGFVNTCIDRVLREISQQNIKEQAQREKEKLASVMKQERSEVGTLEGTNRNQGKLGRFGTESREREKHLIDMLAGK